MTASRGAMVALGKIYLQTYLPWEKRGTMIWTVAAVFLLLWALGVVSSATMGGFIHVLLVAAVVMVLVRIINGPRTLTRA
jgi:hypothetical protein